MLFLEVLEWYYCPGLHDTGLKVMDSGEFEYYFRLCMHVIS